MARVSRSLKRGRRPKLPAQPASYWLVSQEPMACLLLILPMVVVYEVCVWLFGAAHTPIPQLVAHNLIQHFVAWFGTDAAWVPGLAVVVTLVVWQTVRPGRSRPSLRVVLLMIPESIVLTIPLFVLGRVFAQTTGGEAVLGGRAAQVVVVLGAGVYEELVFRFYLVGGLMLLFRHGLVVPRPAAAGGAVIAGALLFAACHFNPIGATPFAWPAYVMTAGAGAYLGLLFVLRGVGISTGCHVAYNILSILLAG